MDAAINYTGINSAILEFRILSGLLPIYTMHAYTDHLIYYISMNRICAILLSYAYFTFID
jgi:hypothetical protein